ncbi:TetR/AcrR family transcriptional regulator [Paenibacillus thiaminolyticus]|uniref:TetR/AcrR family transcriptional regulator n=1 Tax=Paenibacillus thiaminolyticus TaxID=49283 RepID=A0AAP9IZK9_PANTH|nr:TetR/AcrR family transcriptional regulator [Paenibacillus thiaminolyticus]MCY9534798.1 TetR/AcrR family transcriptional regulator [Paenibacillus thiaminolyticus]MCY9603923.1 TetR/AcrR family transcriptional regulator [Paenibacillus thiaminolyticus]MCY9606827.1 TetR/AcrR family transcriptional regulator [Paenibacillus thiaminolyticus]MCY9615819.1 TetR/AcrR family transcriptional regulator [Paenibacillus thiaminolyticus]MCY9619053.1 TetR/AcrR family transcriptional regulator [Paenibacillus th
MSKEDKRKRLIDAAYNVFVKKGYANASIKDIANEADMTSGLVHYYFKNKEELLLSVQDEVQKHYQRQYDGQPEDSVTPEEVLLEIKSRTENNPDWYRWRYEIYSLGIKNESGHLQKQVASILKNGRDSLAKPLQPLVGNSHHASAVASILLACFDGLALQQIVDDEFDIDQSYRLLIELLELYVCKSQELS